MTRNMKNNTKREIQDGLEEFNKTKIMKRSSLSREEFQNSNSVVLTDKQNLLYKSIRSSIMTVVHGPAGTSKTFSTCYTALSLLADKKIEQIIITKPNVQSGPDMGFLPGDINEKIDPYKQSFYTNFCKILDKKTIDFLFATEEIKFEPLNYMRGSTYDNCIMILDESQNSTVSQLMLWATRLGKNSKAVMMGDTSQYDLKKSQSGYTDFIRMVGGMGDLSLFEFNNQDIVRNKFLIELTNRYDKYRVDKDI